MKKRTTGMEVQDVCTIALNASLNNNNNSSSSNDNNSNNGTGQSQAAKQTSKWPIDGASVVNQSELIDINGLFSSNLKT